MRTYVRTRIATQKNIIHVLCNRRTRIVEPDTLRPTLSLPRSFFLLGRCFLLYSFSFTAHNCDNSKKAIVSLPQEEFMDNRLPHEFRNLRTLIFSVKPRWRCIIKHRQNTGKPSFRKLTIKTPMEDTPWTALSNAICVRCEFYGQFRRLVQTK